MNNTNLIFDIGMHTGRDTAFYLGKGFKVIAVEANPGLVEKGRILFKKEIEKGQLVIVDKAISQVMATTDFFVFANKDDWGTTHPVWNRSMDSNVKKISVESITLESLLEDYGTPYYLKIDIEGADILCLKSLLKTTARPTYISIELLTPNNLGPVVDALDILCHLKALGYNKFSIIDQTKNALTKTPQPALEGQYIDYAFDGYSSGLFGKELQGPWLGIDSIAQDYLAYFHNLQNTKNKIVNFLARKMDKYLLKNRDTVFHANGWFDVHAKIEY